MNIDPVSRKLINQFAPQLGEQIDVVTIIQQAYSGALTKEQGMALQGAIKNGVGHFVAWAKTDDGIKAIRDFNDALTGMEKNP